MVHQVGNKEHGRSTENEELSQTPDINPILSPTPPYTLI